MNFVSQDTEPLAIPFIETNLKGPNILSMLSIDATAPNNDSTSEFTDDDPL